MKPSTPASKDEADVVVECANKLGLEAKVFHRPPKPPAAPVKRENPPPAPKKGIFGSFAEEVDRSFGWDGAE